MLDSQMETHLQESSLRIDKSISQQVADGIYIDMKSLQQYLTDDIDLTRIVAQALESAIKEIISPVISRSVTIAMITTREIGLKDFSCEQDELKIKRGTLLKSLLIRHQPDSAEPGGLARGGDLP